MEGDVTPEQQAREWQPIETAPKDDDAEFLGYCNGVIDKTWVGWEDDDGKPVYVHADYRSWSPTHWMPLPDPPTAPPADSAAPR